MVKLGLVRSFGGISNWAFKIEEGDKPSSYFFGLSNKAG